MTSAHKHHHGTECVDHSHGRLPGWMGATLVVIVGVVIAGFALSDNYSRLMSQRFAWLTLSAGVLLLAMGAAGLRRVARVSFADVGALLALAAIVILGKPYAPGIATVSLQIPEGMVLSDMDDADFPLVDLKELGPLLQRGQIADGTAVTVTGVAWRLEDTAVAGERAIMQSYYFCCAADAVAVGLRIAGDQANKFENGHWIVIRGELRKLDKPVDVKPFQVGTSTFSTVNREYIIEPEVVRAYDATEGMPTVIEHLNSDRTSLFHAALKKAGLAATLSGKGPFTLFAPVNASFTPAGTNDITKEWLEWHIVPGAFSKRDLYEVTTLPTLGGYDLPVSIQNGVIYVGKGRMLFGDQQGSNGLVHMITPSVTDP